MKTKDLNNYMFNLGTYSVFTTMGNYSSSIHLIDEMIRLVMNYYHDSSANENIKNPSFLMAWNTLVHLEIYVLKK